jgi:hypothetical protein
VVSGSWQTFSLKCRVYIIYWRNWDNNLSSSPLYKFQPIRTAKCSIRVNYWNIMVWYRFLIFFSFFFLALSSVIVCIIYMCWKILFIQNNRKTYNLTMFYVRNDSYFKCIFISDLQPYTFIIFMHLYSRISFSLYFVYYI